MVVLLLLVQANRSDELINQSHYGLAYHVCDGFYRVKPFFEPCKWRGMVQRPSKSLSKWHIATGTHCVESLLSCHKPSQANSAIAVGVIVDDEHPAPAMTLLPRPAPRPVADELVRSSADGLVLSPVGRKKGGNNIMHYVPNRNGAWVPTFMMVLAHHGHFHCDRART